MSKQPDFHKDNPRYVVEDDVRERIDGSGWRKEPRSRQRRLPLAQLALLRKELEARVRPRPDALIAKLQFLWQDHDRKVLKHRLRGEYSLHRYDAYEQ